MESSFGMAILVGGAGVSYSDNQVVASDCQKEAFVAVGTVSKSSVSELLDFVQREGFGPGDRLPPIRQLAGALGLGRNAVRDALLEAQTHGFVRIEPRLGVFLQELDPSQRTDGLGAVLQKSLGQEEQNLFHLVDARLVVEAELAAEAARMRRPDDLLPLRQALESVLATRGDRLAFIRADEAFHLAIARIAGNRVLLAFLQTLWRLIAPIKLNLLLSSEDRQVTDREHRELFQSIVDGGVDQARTAMRGHIGKGRDLLLDFVRTLPQADAAPEPGRSRRGGTKPTGGNS
jgi:GntR family transcriptional regulator, transcriptional repressor for pyruvate dehydrogenase complex